MELRWSPAASEELLRIAEYIREDNPAAAERVVKSVYESCRSLREYPQKGRAGRVEGTRELALPPLPFVVVYRVSGSWVEIANVIHGAQKWPPGKP